MRIVFFGTPEFAVPTLDALAGAHEVLLAVAQPDKPAGRGMRMQAPAVALRARERSIPVVQPPKIRNSEFLDSISKSQPDIGIVIAYGKILPAALLEIPKYGFLNVHASILPKYRGAAPIQRAIEAGEQQTGVTIMRVDEQLDHGPMLAVATLAIGADERTPSLAKRLAHLGAGALLPVLESIGNGTATETPQDHSQATVAPKIEKQEGAIRWNESARSIYDRFRAFDPWPGVFFSTRGETIKVTNMAAPEALQATAGTVIRIDAAGLLIATAGGAIRIVELQRAGKPRAAAADVARGLGWSAGDRLE